MRVPNQDKNVIEKLVLAELNGAEQRSKEPREVARLAVEALCYVLRRTSWPARNPSDDDSSVRFGAALRLWPDLLGEHSPALDNERVS